MRNIQISEIPADILCVDPFVRSFTTHHGLNKWSLYKVVEF